MCSQVFLSNALSRVSLGDRVDLLSSVFAVLFTFIMSPVLATFFTDSTCFRYLITGESEVAASFEAAYLQCSFNQEGLECSIASTSISTTATPSWFYSNQCSSALVVNYAPVLIYSYLTSGIVLPGLKVAANQLDPDWVGVWMPGFIMRWLYVGWEKSGPSRLTSAGGNLGAPSAGAMSCGQSEGYENNIIIVNDSDVNVAVPPTATITAHSNTSAIINDIKAPGVLSGTRLVDKMLLNATVMSTFGLACPLLLMCVMLDGVSAMCRGLPLCGADVCGGDWCVLGSVCA